MKNKIYILYTFPEKEVYTGEIHRIYCISTFAYNWRETIYRYRQCKHKNQLCIVTAVSFPPEGISRRLSPCSVNSHVHTHTHVYKKKNIYVWIFFLQGHSNNLSSIDVAAGYTGVGRYKPVLVSLLLAISTYSGVIFWYSCLINYQLKDSVQQHKTQIENRWVLFLLHTTDF